jgi:hypothetical protein
MKGKMIDTPVRRLIRFFAGLALVSVSVVAFFLALSAAPAAGAGALDNVGRPLQPVISGQLAVAGELSTPQPQAVALSALQTVTPTITSTPVTSAITGVEYRYLVTTDIAIITWTLTTAPSGMTISVVTNNTALITWTPTSAGSFGVVVEAENDAGVARQSYFINVVLATRTPTPTRTPPSTPIYVDQYEPNNNLQTAYTMAAGQVLQANTLWPAGDIDYFRFHGKAGSVYEIFTRDLDPGIDTVLTAYDTNGNRIASNDDAEPLNRASRVVITAGQSGFYFASVINRDPTDPVDKTYSIEVREVLGPTRIPGVDDCEPNNTFQSACVLPLDSPHQADFVPPEGTGEDNDFYRIWVKEGLFYTCETSALSSLNDTNMILYSCASDQCGIDGNDDKDRLGGDLGSRVSYLASYTGWLYALVGPGPNLEPEYNLSSLYTYTMECTQSAPPTPTPTSTRAASTGGASSGDKGGGTFPPTPTRIGDATATITGTVTIPTPSPTPRPIVVIQPLPTATPAGPQQLEITLEMLVYYDLNDNFVPEATEGIVDVAVAVYDNASGQLLSLGFTNEEGRVRFGPLLTTGPVRIVVPYLSFSQLVVDESASIQLRVGPRPLPGTIP